MDLGQVGKTALGEGTQQVQGGRGLLVCLKQTLGVRYASAFTEFRVVDDVAAERWQFDTVDGFGVAGPWFCELAGDTPDLYDREATE